MRQTKYIVFIVSIVALFCSCNDSFMERIPQTEIVKDNYFMTEQDLKMYCYGLTDIPGYNYVKDSGTDMQATTDNVEVKNIMSTANPTSTTISAGWDWKRLYDINFFLENMGKAQVAEDIKAHYEGIGRYYRASFYMDKVKRFSDVPWYEKTLGTKDTALYKKRDSRDEVVKHIFDDYQYAAEHVKDNQPKAAVDKWTVLAIMARNALYEGTFRKYHPELKLEPSARDYLRIAAQACEKIMDSGNFALYNTGHPESDYLTLFSSADLKDNPEMIQAHYYEKDIADNGFWGADAFGNYIPCPTKKMVQTYLMKDGTYYSSQPDYGKNQFVKEFENRDPRMSQTLAFPGWELTGTTGYATGAGIYVQELNKNFSGYHQIKGFPNSKDENYYMGIDYPTIRYAEVLLIYAESKAELGELNQKVLDETINLLRDRVGMPHLKMGVEIDPMMQSDFPGIHAELLEIRRERSVELAFEGFRFDDLMRWHAGKLLEKVPEGIYFPGLGKFDLTGDGVPDIYLIPSNEEIPGDEDKERNELGKKLIYYRTGTIDDPNASVYLKNGTSGNIQTAKSMGKFSEPRDYYRPVPRHAVDLNKNLLPQIFGWTD